MDNSTRGVKGHPIIVENGTFMCVYVTTECCSTTILNYQNLQIFEFRSLIKASKHLWLRDVLRLNLTNKKCDSSLKLVNWNKCLSNMVL